MPHVPHPAGRPRAAAFPAPVLAEGGACWFAARCPGFAGLFTLRRTRSRSLRATTSSRGSCVRDGGRWTLAHGPFRRADFKALPATQLDAAGAGRQPALAAADALLRRFAFLPYARLDDLMVSYAAPGGGVGPHFDSYDVFLLQGDGRRRWRYRPPGRPLARPGLPLKILRAVHAAARRGAGAGRHAVPAAGVCARRRRVDACTTYSIGFRAPSAQEIAPAFLDRLRDPSALDGRYARPRSRPVARACAHRQRDAGPTRRGRCARMRWDDGTIARFLGAFLSDPSRTSLRSAPKRRCRRAAFAAAVLRARVALGPAARNCSTMTTASLRQRRRGPTACRGAATRCGDLANARGLERARSVARGRVTPLSTVLAMDSSTSDRSCRDDGARGGAVALDTVAEQTAAIDELIGLARHRSASSIRIFRRADGTARARVGGGSGPSFGESVAAGSTSSCMTPLSRAVLPARLRCCALRYAMTIYRTGAEARHAIDPLLIVDDRHYLHRFHFEQPRATMGIDQPEQTRPLAMRFEEIWATGEPGVNATVLGL